MVTVGARSSHIRSSSTGRFRIALPERSATLEQDAEWFTVEEDGQSRDLRFHDYGEIYERPGLYEQLFYEVLECDSPAFVSGRLVAALQAEESDPSELRVLDLGAGNGIMAETLQEHGVDYIVGADIIPEAEAAAARDRPGAYADYLVADLSEPTADHMRTLEGHRLNCLTCVAALGFGDIPPECFRRAYNLIADGGWVAFTIRKDFLSATDTSGFATLVRAAIDGGQLKLVDAQVYPHRRSSNGEQLHYTSVIGTKITDIPAAAAAG
jgi:predicted TPR repeat methyltransferase